MATCERCGTVLDARGRDHRERHHGTEACLGALQAEVKRLRAVHLDTLKCAAWSLEGADPHDWRKGLEIIKTAIEGDPSCTQETD